MPDSVIVVPHPPALKVGGRRCSVSNKPKPHNSGNQLAEPAGSGDTANNEAVPEDYPRPAPPGEGQVHQHDTNHTHHDEELKKEKKQQPSNEKMKEYAHWKAETTRPTRDVQGIATKAWGAGGRIAQPAGKGFGV